MINDQEIYHAHPARKQNFAENVPANNERIN